MDYTSLIPYMASILGTLLGFVALLALRNNVACTLSITYTPKVRKVAKVAVEKTPDTKTGTESVNVPSDAYNAFVDLYVKSGKENEAVEKLIYK